MIDTVSGAEVPEPEIAVSPAMIEAGISADFDAYAGMIMRRERIEIVFRAMRRVELTEARAARQTLHGRALDEPWRTPGYTGEEPKP